MTEHDGYEVAYFPAKVIGQDYLCVVVGRSFKLDRSKGRCEPEEESQPLARFDELFKGENPFRSSVRRASDFEPLKERVDLVLHATAHSPGRKPLESWSVVLRVGSWSKELVVIGPRFCKYVAARKKGKQKIPSPPRFSAPEPVSEVPLRYENAFGGRGLYIPEDEEAFLEAKRKAEEVQARAQEKAVVPAPPPVEIPEIEALSWDDPVATGGSGADSDGRVLLHAEGSASADLEPELLAGRSGLTRELDVGQLGVFENEEEGEAGQERAFDHEGTRVLAVAESGKEKVVEGDWEQDLIEDKAEPTPEKQEEESEFPRIDYRANPVGKGFAVSHARKEIEGLALPLIEDPRRLISPEDIPCSVQDQDEAPLPAGFGPLGRSWAPRADFAGLSPAQKEQVRDKMDEYILSLDPENDEDKAAIIALADQELPDYDPRVHNFAPSDQQLEHLRGTEVVRIEGVSPEGPLEFRLPGRFPLASLDRGEGEELLALSLDTIEIDTDEDRVVQVWRGRVEMRDEAEIMDYPHIRVRIEDFDSEQGTSQSQARKKEGGTDILEAFPEDQEEKAAAPGAVAGRSGDLAWKEGEEREVNPLSETADLTRSSEEEFSAKKAERKKRRAAVEELREKLREEARADLKKKKGRSKKGKGKKA